jgi:hypothetical protein
LSDYPTTDSFAALARWTPVRLDFSGPTPAVDWADLSSERAWSTRSSIRPSPVGRPPARPLVRTGLEALVALDCEPSLELAGIIFHLSRCGSTLVSRLLGTLPGIVVVTEPAPLNALLGLDPDRIDDATLVQLVRLVVRALGRCRHGNERRLVLKCTSWTSAAGRSWRSLFPKRHGSGFSATRHA